MSDSVWIKKLWRDTVWAMLHNIRIQVSKDVTRPVATPFGVGTAAGINIQLPSETGEEASSYSGPFAVRYDSGSKKLRIGAGWLFCNGVFGSVPAGSVAPANGILCVTAELADGEWSKPEIKFADPSGTAHPIARVAVAGGSVVITQFPVTVAQLMTVKQCILAEV